MTRPSTRPGVSPRGPSADRAGGLARAAAAEQVGTFMLVLIGTAVATAATLNRETAGQAYDSLAIALSFGLVLAAIVAALGQVSGAHVNPAVTIGLASVGRFPWAAVPAYLAAQLVGGVLAALTVWAAYGPAARDRAGLGSPAPVDDTNALQGFMVEALIAFILVLVVVGVATDRRAPAGVAPLAIGFALAAGVLLGGPVTGGAGNPARALGPMVVSGTWDAWYIYVLGPVVGGVIGAAVYAFGVGPGSPPGVAVADRTDQPAA
jgi:MIP family channel proteins